MRSAATRARVSSVARAADLPLLAGRERRPSDCPPGHVTVDAARALLARCAPRIERHQRAVARLAGVVTAGLGLPETERAAVVRAAELHDIGKIAVPARILHKRGPLDAAELAVMREHTVVGQRMLLRDRALRPLAALVRASHERWDGSGYPDGLRGEEIPLGARVITICDAYDAMTSDRPYRPARSPEDAVREVGRGAGRRYDPRIVPVFLVAVARLSDARA